MSRHREPPLVDPASHPRRAVGLKVAADYLGVHRDTLRRRIEEGKLHTWRDGNIYRISVAALVRYKRMPPEGAT